jgi:tripartite-type tricarboxylate transporter receptor subunit TctC
MWIRIFGFIFLFVFGFTLIPGKAVSADYPTREIEFIAAFAPGSSTDSFARLAAKFGEKYIGKPLVVVNKTGGGGVLGYASLAAAKPNGYTIGLLGMSFLVHQYLLKVVTYNYKKDFRIIAQVDYSAEAFFTIKGGPYDIPLKEFVKKAKEKPGAIKIGVGGSVWGGQDFARAVFEDTANVKLNKVPFPTLSGFIAAVLGGHVDIGVGPAAEWASLYKAGKLGVLALCTDKRDPRFPDIPTTKELGFDVGDLSPYHWIGAPKGTPDPIINFLAEAYKKAFAEQSFKDACSNLGATASWDSPEGSIKTMEKVERRYLDVIKKNDVKPQ